MSGLTVFLTVLDSEILYKLALCFLISFLFAAQFTSASVLVFFPGFPAVWYFRSLFNT